MHAGGPCNLSLQSFERLRLLACPVPAEEDTPSGRAQLRGLQAPPVRAGARRRASLLGTEASPDADRPCSSPCACAPTAAPLLGDRLRHSRTHSDSLRIRSRIPTRRCVPSFPPAPRYSLFIPPTSLPSSYPPLPTPRRRPPGLGRVAQRPVADDDDPHLPARRPLGRLPGGEHHRPAPPRGAPPPPPPPWNRRRIDAATALTRSAAAASACAALQGLSQLHLEPDIPPALSHSSPCACSPKRRIRGSHRQ